MPSPASPSISRPVIASAERLLRLALALTSAGMVLLFLYTAARRLHYPFALDEVEGNMFASVWHIAHGLPLYPRPTTDFVPFLYTPLYYYTAAALAKLTGLSFIPLRLLSTLSTLGCMAVIYAFVFAETHKHLPSLAAAGLYAACYSPLGGWFDIGRVDSFSVFLFLLAIYCTRRAPILLAALVWVLAFQAKQGVLPIALLIFCADWRRPRRMLLGMGSFLVGIATSVLLLNRFTGGWYNYYVFGAGRGLGWLWRQFVFYLPVDFFLPLGLVCLLLLAAVLFAPPSLRTPAAHFLLLVSFAVYAAVWYLRAHYGSSVNTLMPAYAWTAILFGLALARLLSWLEGQGSHYARLGIQLVLAAAIAQLIAHIYQPGRFDPAAAVRDDRAQLIAQLRAIPGDIYDLDHADNAIFAGKQPHAFINAFGLVTQGPPSQARTVFMQQLQQQVDARRFSAFVVDLPLTPDYLRGAGLPVEILDNYPVIVVARGNAITDVTSMQPHEKWIYLPCDALHWDLSTIVPTGTSVLYGSCLTSPPSHTTGKSNVSEEPDSTPSG